MKTSIIRMFTALLAAAALIFTSCDMNTPDSFSVNLAEVGPDYVSVRIQTPSEVPFAYVLSAEPVKYLKPAVIFSLGKEVQVVNNQVLRLEGLELQSATKYYIACAAKLDSQNFSEVYTFEFTTAEYNFSELLTVVDTYHDGFKYHITVPEETKQRGNAIRYNFVCLPMYNVIKYYSPTPARDDEMLLTNGDVHRRRVTKDSTLVINGWNVNELDAAGKPLIDPETGDPVAYHDPLVPGEPVVLLAGEFKWGKDSDVGYAGWGEGYFVPTYNQDKKEWEGAFSRLNFRTREPELLKGNLDIEITDLGPIDATITFKPDQNVGDYCYAVLEKSAVNLLKQYLDDRDSETDNPEDLFQWFTTSMFGFYNFACDIGSGNMSIKAGDKYFERLQERSNYELFVTACGNEKEVTPEGIKTKHFTDQPQRFYRIPFETTKKTLETPVIQVTARPTDNNRPHTALFNIKNVGPDPLEMCFYGFNYVSEWMLALGPENDYTSLVKGNNKFDANDLEKINSPEGLDVDFPLVIDGEVTRLAVYGCNREYTYNKLSRWDSNCQAVADYEVPYEPAVPAVSSNLFQKLSGEWTATAKLSVSQKDDKGDIFFYETEHSSRVVIGSKIPNLPDALPEEVYTLYKDMERAEVDALYDELKSNAENFQTYRLTDHNRLLCSGFIDYEADKEISPLTFFNPYDLFTSTNYSSYNTAQILNDFGPKWYLEVKPDGSVVVPFNKYILPPMAQWARPDVFYMGAYDKQGGHFFDEGPAEDPGKIVEFPVEVSKDYNTITVKPIILPAVSGDGTTAYYINAINYTPQGIFANAPIVSDLVLTRGWNPSKNMKRASVNHAPIMPQNATVAEGFSNSLPSKAVIKSITPLKPAAEETIKDGGRINIITAEDIDNIMLEYTRQQLKKQNIDIQL